MRAMTDCVLYFKKRQITSGVFFTASPLAHWLWRALYPCPFNLFFFSTPLLSPVLFAQRRRLQRRRRTGAHRGPQQQETTRALDRSEWRRCEAVKGVNGAEEAVYIGFDLTWNSKKKIWTVKGRCTAYSLSRVENKVFTMPAIPNQMVVP